MSDLFVRFVLELDAFDTEPYRFTGAAFHRWLPDGARDAIQLPVHDTKSQLRVWFERRHHTSHGILRYDQKARGCNTSRLARQSVVDSGPLRGELRLNQISDADIRRLLAQDSSAVHGKRKCPTYMRLAKRVATLIQPPVTRFLEVIKHNFGQYWIEILQPWDSRDHSLASYCYNILNASWRLKGTRLWMPFAAGERISTISMPGGSKQQVFGSLYLENITQKDWQELPQYLRDSRSTSAAARAASRAHAAVEQRDFRYALIEATLAAELAVSAAMTMGDSETAALRRQVNRFLNDPVGTQVATAALMKGVDRSLVALALEAVDLRNKVVHEGFSPRRGTFERQLYMLLRIVSLLDHGPPLKFPATPGLSWHFVPAAKWRSTANNRVHQLQSLGLHR